MTIRAVAFDVGETLVDETRHWSEWADWLGVPRFMFMATFGGVIAAGRHHRETFTQLRPGFDFAAESRAREATGWRYEIRPEDFYSDAVPCLRKLREQGFRVGVAGNQLSASEAGLKALDVPLDLIGSSERWNVEKPNAAFFVRLAAEFALSPNEIAYVGDHPVNDIAPAVAAGMTAIFVRRGPWGILKANTAEAALASARVESLAELPDLLAHLRNDQR